MITSQTRTRIAELLGREPRGLEDVPLVSDSGEPMVIRVASLVDDKPFPTLFWLVDPGLCLRIDRAEAAGLIRQFQRRIDADPVIQEKMRQDNLAHIRLRQSYIDDLTAERLQALGFGDVLARKGIGGLGDFARVRCLHTWYAAHLVVPNTVGDMLDMWWAEAA
jgi:hypothetical protein